MNGYKYKILMIDDKKESIKHISTILSKEGYWIRSIDDKLKEIKNTILLVDDEEMLRTVGEKILINLGYNVFLAKDGQEAVNIYSQKRDEIDLVLLDMIMPVMNGRNCFVALKEINPKLPVVVVSGYCNNNDMNELLAKGCIGFVKKPYTIKVLSSMLDKTLNII